METPLSSHRKRRRQSSLWTVSSLIIYSMIPNSQAYFTSSRINIKSNNLLATRINEPYTQAVDMTRSSSKYHTSSKQFKPRYVAYEESKFPNNDLLFHTPEIRSSTPGTLPTATEKLELSEKIARLLHDESPLLQFDMGGQIANRESVFAKLSDEDLREASDAVSNASSNPGAEKYNSKRKRKVTANVMETGQDTIAQYVKSFANHHVLSAHDEIVLGEQIQILSNWERKRLELESTLLRAPTFDEWAAELNTSVLNLRNQVRRSQKAKAALVEANLRLVVTVARQSVKKNRSEICFQDACQEGIIGLSRAAEKFDPDKGFRFSSYAVWWIRKMIHKNVSEQSRPFRLPASAMKKINDIRIHEKVLQDELGRKPRDHEIASKVGISLEKLEFYRRALQDVISLDKKVKFKKASNDNARDPDLHEVVVDPSHSPIESVTTQMLKDDVRRLIRTLSPREQAVIRLRFGLDNGTPASVDDVARKFKVERDQVQKIELRALKKLQEPYRNASLKPYIVDF